jgi:hypothetical protein
MRTTYLAATVIAATLPLTAILAEDTAQTGTTDQKQEQGSDQMGMKASMMSNLKDQDAQLEKLVAEVNGAQPDRKLDAVAAVVTKLVEERRAMHDQMRKMMSANEREGMDMCRKMMGMDKGAGHEGEHTAHH